MVCAVAGAFWVSKLHNAVVKKLSGGGVDLQMTEGVSSMALQQGGLGLIMSLLIITVPMLAAEFFMGMLGHFNHYSMFGGYGGSMSMPGPLGQPPGTYQAPTQTVQARTGQAYEGNTQPEIQRTTAPRPDRTAAVSLDVIRRAPLSSEPSGDRRTDLRPPDPLPERS
jgi:type IV secretion system protein VirB6